MGAVVQLLNEKFKEKYFFTIAATAGGTENVRRMATGEYQSGLAHVFTMAEAWNAEGLFEGKKPFKEMKVLLRTTDQPLGVAALAKSSIKKFPDLIGKRVNLGPPGSGNLYVGTVVLKALGLLDKVKVGHLNNTAGAEALRDGQIDAVMMPGAPFMSPSLIEISRSVDIRLIEPATEEANKVVKDVPYLYVDVIPPNKAPGENANRERKAFFWSVFWIALGEMPDEVIYDMLKVTYDNREDLGKVVGYWATAGPSFSSLEKLGIPYHLGAVKFWKEKGIKFPPDLAK
jgi:TRAP transporter TAXI family solute receptor